MSDYAPFQMCPFTQVKIGGNQEMYGLAGETYVWTHSRCIGHHCKLYTYKFDKNDEAYAEGCNMQFLGLTPDEIRLNFQVKNDLIQKWNDEQ